MPISNNGDAGSVQKFGQDWLELSADRRPKGVELWVKAVPQVEEYFKTLANSTPTGLESFGRAWYPVGGPIKVYVLEQEVQSDSYQCNAVCGAMGAGVKERINLSFLQFVGISKPEGIKFGISGPMDKESIRMMTKKILSGCYRLFKDHIAPVHIEFKLSATEI